MSDLITVEKDGTAFAVHPNGLAEHQRLGWSVVKEPVPMTAPTSALDHDGEPGGSLPAIERGLDDLRAEAEALGVRTDRRWGESRLRDEIAKARG